MRIFRILFSLKTWIILVCTGVLLQTIGFVFFGLGSVNHISPLVLYALIWLLITFAIRRFHRNNKAKRLNYSLINTSVFICLMLIETGLRISMSRSTHTEKHLTGCYQSPYNLPNKDFWTKKRTKDVSLSSPEFSYTRKINSEGFSDREWTKDRSKYKSRILTLGDSFTEGDGADADSTWQRFMERKTSDSSLNILNAGISGSDPVFEYYLLEHRLAIYNPDLVIICINSSDIYDIAIRGGFERFNNDVISFREGPWWEPLFAISHISRLFFMTKYDRNLLDKSKVSQIVLNSSLILADAMNRFATFCKNNHAQVLFVFHPTQSEVKKGENPFKDLMTISENKGFTIVDLFQYYSSLNIQNELTKYYWPMDGHHNANGYDLMATGILNEIKTKKLIETKKLIPNDSPLTK